MKFFFLIFLTQIINLKYFEQTIENCEAIDKIDNNKCEKCEDKHFLFNNIIRFVFHVMINIMAK